MTNTVTVWDLPTRLFHWALLSAVVYSWLSVEVLEDMQQHFYSGYAVLTLLLWRLAWGFVGSRYSRFRRFFFPPRELLDYAKAFFCRTARGTNTRYLGHNPLGSLSALAIILVLLIQGSLGLFSTDDYFFGPLAGLVGSDTMAQLTGLHLDNVNLIYVLLGLHLAAIIYYQVVKKESLTKAMVTGRKNNVDDKAHQPKPASNLLALVLLLLSAGLVYWLTNAYVDLLPAADYDYY